MTDFTITEDFPKNEIEFDKRFFDPKACYEYLFRQKWPNGFICKKLNLKELLDFGSYATAWSWLQKLW